MTGSTESPKRESEPPPGMRVTPIPPPVIPTSIPQKRAMVDDDHTPAVRSPLNPESKTARAPSQAREDPPSAAREKRTKKETLKKRESKVFAGGESARATPEPRRTAKGVKIDESLPVRYKLHGPLKACDFELAQGPVFRSHHETVGPDGETIEFFETAEQPLNRKGYIYEHSIADPTFPSSLYYRKTEPKPYCAHMSFEDVAPYIYFNQDGSRIAGDHGFRMARANVGMREGRWYWECKILRGCIKHRKPDDPESHGHVRIGWARREASRDAPVGYDAYSYGIRDKGGQKMHMSRPKDFFPAGEDIEEGDVIGLELQLPSEALHRKIVRGIYNPAVDLTDEEPGSATEGPNVVRDRIPFRFQNTKPCFERFDYHPAKELEDLMNPSPMVSAGSGGAAEPPNPNHTIPSLRTLPGSHIKIYKNGVSMGTAFTNLLAFLPPASSANSKMQEGARERLDDGSLGYYPAISVFRGGAAEANFGPNFWYPPPGYKNATGEDIEMADADINVDARKEADNAQTTSSLTKLRAAEGRFDEQIVEDIVYDIVDEVSFWMQDGAQAVPRVPLAREDSKDKDVTMLD